MFPRICFAMIFLAGCGSEPAISVHFSSAALFAEASSVSVAFFADVDACADLPFPRPQAAIGPFNAGLNDESRSRGIEIERANLPVGPYIVAADALDGDALLLGSGCRPVRIEPGVRTEISLKITRIE